jgi:hypothetical protein
MSKKILKDILKLYALPLYVEENEFLDKLASYLYARYQLSKISLLSPSELDFDVTRLTWDHFVVRTDQGQVAAVSEDVSLGNINIQDIYLRIRLGGNPDRYVRIVIPKLRRYFKKMKQLTTFIKLFKAYLSHQLDLVAQLKAVKPVTVALPTVIPPVEPTEYLMVHPTLMPESIKMPQALDKVEKQLIKEMLKRVGGVKITAAKQLGITERMIGYQMKKLKI